MFRPCAVLQMSEGDCTREDRKERPAVKLLLVISSFVSAYFHSIGVARPTYSLLFSPPIVWARPPLVSLRKRARAAKQWRGRIVARQRERSVSITWADVRRRATVHKFKRLEGSFELDYSHNWRRTSQSTPFRSRTRMSTRSMGERPVFTEVWLLSSRRITANNIIETGWRVGGTTATIFSNSYRLSLMPNFHELFYLFLRNWSTKLIGDVILYASSSIWGCTFLLSLKVIQINKGKMEKVCWCWIMNKAKIMNFAICRNILKLLRKSRGAAFWRLSSR